MGMFRKSGGFDGTITGVSFDIKEWEAKKGGEAYSTISVQLDVHVDGAEESSPRFLNAGFSYDGTTVSEDGHSLESDSDGAIIQENTEFARFIGSLVEKGFPEATLEAGNGRNFDMLVGTRVQLTQWVDEEATAKFGKRKSKKDGKEYNRTELRVAQVYAMPDPNAKKAAVKKVTGKPVVKAAPAKASKATAASLDTDDVDNAITEILASTKDNTVARGSLNSAIIRYALANKETVDREALRKALNDDYLTDAAERGVVTFDGKTIGLAA
jgi:hypothetical protein